ncbi:hypothetical protein [Hydrogenophaga sp.]|jgi:hypothetical protein|uniref:hypothetical protein n=1 Tax=Hydrogenophaga sp. TaxID=1904254 RepID=UPI003F7034DF
MASQSSKSSPKKPKLVRDSFTIPKTEFVAIDALKSRAISLGTSVKKSELLRAGLMVLKGLSDAAYKAALTAVPTLKTGRPTGADKPAKAAPAKTASTPTKATPKPAVKRAVKAAVKVGATRKPAAKAPAKAPARKVAAKKTVAKKAATPVGKPA